MYLKSKIHQMFSSEIATWMFKILLPPTWILAWIVNLDNIKSSILFIVALVFGSIRFYFWADKALHQKRMRDLDRLDRQDDRDIKKDNKRVLKKWDDEEGDEYTSDFKKKR